MTMSMSCNFDVLLQIHAVELVIEAHSITLISMIYLKVKINRPNHGDNSHCTTFTVFQRECAVY